MMWHGKLTRLLSWISGVRTSKQDTGVDCPTLFPVYQAISRNTEDSYFVGGASLSYGDDGNLIPGIYRLNRSEFESLFCRSRARRKLIEGLSTLLSKLAESGCKRVYIGGSFASKKRNPADFDAVYDAEGVDFDLLRKLDRRILMERDEDANLLQAEYGGVVEPMRTLPSLGFSMLEVLQYDTRSQTFKGLVLLELD